MHRRIGGPWLAALATSGVSACALEPAGQDAQQEPPPSAPGTIAAAVSQQRVRERWTHHRRLWRSRWAGSAIRMRWFR